MQISELNDLTNDLLVARLEVSAFERELEAELNKNPRIKELEGQISAAKMSRDMTQAKYLTVLTDNNLKQWKTDRATVTRARRDTVKIKPLYESEIKQRLIDGEEIEWFQLNTTNYISIRLPSEK
jgi:hypothetical protein